jgi:segregation and condensation protein B
MTELDLQPALEAVLMVADQPLDHLVLAEAVGHPPADVEQALHRLATSYDDEGRGFRAAPCGRRLAVLHREAFRAGGGAVRDSAASRRGLTHAAASRDAAVVAYKQPISGVASRLSGGSTSTASCARW